MAKEYRYRQGHCFSVQHTCAWHMRYDKDARSLVVRGELQCDCGHPNSVNPRKIDLGEFLSLLNISWVDCLMACLRPRRKPAKPADHSRAH